MSHIKKLPLQEFKKENLDKEPHTFSEYLNFIQMCYGSTVTITYPYVNRFKLEPYTFIPKHEFKKLKFISEKGKEISPSMDNVKNNNRLIWLNIADLVIYTNISIKIIQDRIDFAMNNKLLDIKKKNFMKHFTLYHNYKDKYDKSKNIFITNVIFPTLFCKNTLYPDELHLKQNVISIYKNINKIINTRSNYNFLCEEIENFDKKIFNKYLKGGYNDFVTGISPEIIRIDKNKLY